jgi:prenyltransferase beta subunit
MSQRLQMLQVARLARRSLGESADLVASFAKSLADPSGGYCNRGGRPDLYYTAFALDVLAALDALPGDDTESERAEQTRSWLERFGDGATLDFVHRCCLARAWASQPPAACSRERRAAIAGRIAAHRAYDGGYASQAGAARGTAYGCFLAVNAFADLRHPPPEPADAFRAGILRSLEPLRADDGGWSNSPGQQFGTTTATAAVVATLRAFDHPAPAMAAEWLLARRHPSGGFSAGPDAPIPDLLSTAVALHALDAMDAPWRDARESVLDYLDSLWTAEGAFHGSWADDQPDVEYTFYGLVALGHASV